MRDLINRQFSMQWKIILKDTLNNYNFNDKLNQLELSIQNGAALTPDPENLFAPYSGLLERVNAVIINNKPHVQRNTGHGLEFKGKRLKPRSIKHLEKELGTYPGNLDCWREQGILLLNDNIAMVDKKPQFNYLTRPTIEALVQRRENLAYLLIGPARKYAPLIPDNNLVILSDSFARPVWNKLAFKQMADYLREKQNIMVNFDWEN